MLHRSLLPGHARWARFFGSLRYVVIDECHHYRGVFGAHVSHVLRRLRRVCALYGADPTFVLASATVAEPDVLAGRLTGHEVTAVTDDASPRGEVVLGLWEPPFTGHLGENGAPVRRAASSEVADLLTDLVVEGIHTLAFIRSRRGAEAVAATASALLAEVAPELADRVAPYRGGYLPEERRALEQALRSGRLVGLAATNALELGIDVSGLDAVLMAGFPGTRAQLWQQVGRAGRSGQDALGVMVARDDPLDTYLVNHPEMLLGRPVEASVFDPANHYVLGPHLCAAAEESPLTEADLPLFGPTAREAVDRLTEAGLLRRRSSRWFWTDRRRASDLADIRSSGGQAVQLVESVTGRVVGTVDASSAHGTAHEGAVYVHLGETWLVRSLDLDEHVAIIERAEPTYSTSAREVTDIRILAEREHVPWGPCRLSFGEVEVAHQVVSYLKRRVPSGEVIAEEPLDLPERTLRTAAVWWTVPAAVLEDAGLADRRPAGGRARRRARVDRPAAAVRDLRPLGHRRRLDRPAPRHRPAHGVRLRRPSGRRRLRRAGVRRGARLARRHPRGDPRLCVHRGLPELRAVTQVRQPEPPPRQGGRGRPARRAARRPLSRLADSCRSVTSCRCTCRRATVSSLAPIVAVLGTGTMGAGMARNIAAAGLPLRVWNRTAAKAEPLADVASGGRLDPRGRRGRGHRADHAVRRRQRRGGDHRGGSGAGWRRGVAAAEHRRGRRHRAAGRPGRRAGRGVRRRTGARHPQARRGRRAGGARLRACRRSGPGSPRCSTRSAAGPCGSARPGPAPA